MDFGISDQAIIKKITNKENELVALQECRDIIERLSHSSVLHTVHADILENALSNYETSLVNDLQNLEEFVENSVYRNWSAYEYDYE